MSGLAKLLGRFGISYEAYRIVKQPVPAASPAFPDSPVTVVEVSDLDQFDTAAPEVRALRQYAGTEAIGFLADLDGRVVGGCWYWFGDRYRTRGFIELPPGAAKLVQVTVDATARGMGIAPVLIARSSRAMSARGFTSLYARIWHSHSSSWSAFQKAAWIHDRFRMKLRWHPPGSSS